MKSALLILALSSACVASDAKPGASPPPTDSLAKGVRDTATRAESPVAGGASPVADSRAAAQTDSGTPHLIPGRSRHDSLAFASTVAFGRRQNAKWPTPPAPLPGSILPGHRIVVFYGNPLSRKMGVLGEYDPPEMLAKLDTAVHQWEAADPSTPVQPALQLIAVVAQGAPGKAGLYRLRMDSSLIEKVYGWAQQRHALLFLDIQVGKGTMQQELPRLMPFLSRPDVHLAMDAEFAMHRGAEGNPPGKRIGQFDAEDINWVSAQLRQLVSDKKLPPKVLIVHRWTKAMISNAPKINVDPRVQIVMDMDGWGPPWMKFESFRDYIDLEPVEYTGFKLFFHNDTKGKNALLTPGELLWLRPRLMYIQYQ